MTAADFGFVMMLGFVMWLLFLSLIPVVQMTSDAIDRMTPQDRKDDR